MVMILYSKLLENASPQKDFKIFRVGIPPKTSIVYALLTYPAACLLPEFHVLSYLSEKEILASFN